MADNGLITIPSSFPVRETVETVQVLDELALVVGLKEARGQAQLPGGLGDLELELGEGQLPVVGGVPPAQLIEVDAVHHLDSIANVLHGAD